MTINVNNLEKIIIEKMNSASTEKELLEYAKIIEKLKTGTVKVVDTFSDLPMVSDHVNELYYVSDEKIVYLANEDFGWVIFHLTVSLQLYSWGKNFFGQIGDGTVVCRSSPVQEVSSSTDWCQVSSGYTYNALKTSGTLWGWGLNNDGQIGDGTTTNRCSPVQEFTSSTDWCQMSSNIRHSLALKTSGTLWGWGRNSAGEIGDETTIERSSPVQEVSSSTDWCQVSSGNEYSLALKTSGKLWAWGENYRGQIGDGTNISRSSPVQEITSSNNWCQASTGQNHSLALKTSGTLWGWGNNNSGRLGDGTTTGRSSPVQEITSSTDWCQVDGGQRHSLALKTSGTLWGWGSNIFGKIGDGTTFSRLSPVQEITSSTNWCQVSAGGYYSLALKTSGTLWAWGDNDRGKLGDGTNNDRSSPVQEVTSSTDWCQVSAILDNSSGIRLLQN